MLSRTCHFFFWIYLLFLIGADSTIFNPLDPDLWHRLALGEVLCKTTHFPASNTFSYLADTPYDADHEWGSAVLFYLFYRAFGLNGFLGLKLVALALTLFLTLCAGLYRRPYKLLAIPFYALILLALLPSFQSTVRCMIFTHLFFALWLYWFQAERQRQLIPTLAYPAIMLLWVNLHGGFVIGLLWLFLLMVVDDAAREKWMLRFVLCVLITLVNPFGWRLWSSTARALATSRQGFEEWGPVSWSDFFAYPGYKLLLLLGAVIFISILWSGKWRRFQRGARTSLLLVGLFAIPAFLSARHTSLFALVAGALLPEFLPLDYTANSFRHPFARLGYLALASTLLTIPLCLAVMVLPKDKLAVSYPQSSCPVGAVDYLKANRIRGRLLIPFNYGSYALWQLRGQMRVSMDGRYDLAYLPGTYRRVEAFFLGKKEGLTLLTDPPPDAILLPVTDAVYPLLLHNAGWNETYRDDANAVFLPASIKRTSLEFNPASEKFSHLSCTRF